MTEDEHSQHFFDLLERDPAALSWFLGRIEAEPTARLHPSSKASQWRYSREWKRWWETDIYLLLELKGDARHAVHVEDKLTAGFTPDQVSNYERRAKEWSTRPGEEYGTWTTVLIAPADYLRRHRPEIEPFKHRISHEEIASKVPEFLQVGLASKHSMQKERETSISFADLFDQPQFRVFFAGARAAPKRIRTRPIGTTGGPQIREFEYSRFRIEPGIVNATPGFWVTLPISELNRRGIAPGELLAIERTVCSPAS